MRRFRTSLILAVILCALSAVAYWNEWKTKTEETAEKDENKLLSFEVASVSGISYQSLPEDAAGKTEQFKLVKKDGTWFITEPISAKAQGPMIDNFLKAIGDYKYTKVVGEDKSAWSKFGLDTPQRQIEFSFGGSDVPTKTLYVGAKGVVGYNAYARTNESEKVYIGSQILITETAKTIMDFRHKEIADINEQNLSRIFLKKPGTPEIRLEKEANDYKILTPIQAKADAEEVNELVSALKSAMATEFIDAPNADQIKMFAPNNLTISITMGYADASTSTLLFAKSDGGFWASYSPTHLIFKVDTSLQEKVDKKLFDFQDRRIFSADANEVTELILDGKAYAKVDGEWYKTEELGLLKDPKTKEQVEPQSHLQSLVADVTQAKAKEPVPAASATKALAQPPLNNLKFKITTGKETNEVALNVWRYPGHESLLLVKVGGKNEVFAIDKSVISALDPESANLEPSDLGGGGLEGLSN